MKLEYLTDREDALPILANWYHEEWGYLNPERTEEQVQDSLKQYFNSQKAPLMVLATQNKTILGAAQLKLREMDMFPEKEHWLGGVYVAQDSRGRGIASELTKKIISLSVAFGINTLHLQTNRHDGGLYKKLGWEPVELVNHRNEEVLVMENRIITMT